MPKNPPRVLARIFHGENQSNPRSQAIKPPASEPMKTPIQITVFLCIVKLYHDNHKHYTELKSHSLGLIGLRESVSDDVQGKVYNHSFIIYGNNEVGNFLIADRWEQPGFHEIEPERMLATISAAQIECDNLLFQISPLNA